jgi:hypothetical protein
MMKFYVFGAESGESGSAEYDDTAMHFLPPLQLGDNYSNFNITHSKSHVFDNFILEITTYVYIDA